MNKKYINRVVYLSVIITLILSSATYALSAEYDSMKGVTSVKAVYDFRIANPKAAAGHLNLIHGMISDSNLMINGNKPKIVIVFIGPSVKLVSTSKEGLEPEQQKAMDEIADKISKMDKDGIKFEICMTAAHLMGIKADTILPMLKQVGNGWISVIGYQHNGYALVSDF